MFDCVPKIIPGRFAALFALLLLFSQPAYCENAGGVVGDAQAGSLWNTSVYVLETGNANCSFRIDRMINSSITLSVMTTTVTNLGGSECALPDFLISDTIPQSFAGMPDISFTPAYSIDSGSTIGFAIPLFLGKASKSFTYSVPGWVSPSRMRDFPPLLLSARTDVAAESQPSPNQEEKPSDAPKAAPGPLAPSAPEPMAVASFVVGPEGEPPQDGGSLPAQVLNAIYAVLVLLAVTSLAYAAVKNKGNNIWDDANNEMPPERLGGQDRLPPERQTGGYY